MYIWINFSNILAASVLSWSVNLVLFKITLTLDYISFIILSAISLADDFTLCRPNYSTTSSSVVRALSTDISSTRVLNVKKAI